MTRIRPFNIVLFILFGACANAQINAKRSDNLSGQHILNTGKLNIGDILPDLPAHTAINHTSEKIDLSKFKDQLLIIDFFATWCGPCVKALPKLDSLQLRFGNQIKIVAVSNEKRLAIESFLNKGKVRTKLPIIVSDSLLGKLFPSRIIPHEIWIHNGIIKAITSDKELNAVNIELMLQGKNPILKEKHDFFDFDNRKLLFTSYFQDGNPIDTSIFRKSSILTSYMDGLPTGASMDRLIEKEQIRSFSAFNCLPIRLYNFAYSMIYAKSLMPLLNSHRIVLNVKDPNACTYPTTYPYQNYQDMDEFQRVNAVCYEFKLPEYLPDSLFAIRMIDDLNSMFKITAKIEKRRVTSWVLVRSSNDNNLLKTNGGKTFFDWYSDKGIINIQNKSLDELTRFLNVYRNIEPVINETGYFSRVDMQLNVSTNTNEYLDIPAIKASLQKYGLDLLRAEREVDILIISDK
jgi:thiol-disulfide isomerase/thioredoxin